MAVKLYEIHSELFKSIGDVYSKFSHSDLIKLDLLTKVLIESNIDFAFKKEEDNIVIEISKNAIPLKVATIINKLKYQLVDRRIKIL